MFFPKAEELARVAAKAEAAGEKDKASEYYLSVLPTSYPHALLHCVDPPQD